VEAIRALKAQGYKVGLYPFVLMDIPHGFGKPNPYGSGDQAAYPWRGRITASVAPGLTGTPDKTSAAAGQVGAFFGSAAASHFPLNSGALSVGYTGPNEWSLRRFILHYAKLAQLAGGVDSFVLGSELVGLTTLRSGQGQFPAVDALKTLAADVRGVLGASPTLTYGADWTEYAGYRPQDGSHDVYFHLDPLWADPAISAVGLDWYPPLSDWRDGAHTDQALAESPHDAAYLESRIEGGEAFDWYYASDQHRQDQIRTPITDGAYGKPWVFRAKDLRSFWNEAHRNRPGGVEASTPTAWVPQSKPFWFVELGCPAVDKGSNGPNLFLDAKSSESALPAFSNGTRDDLIQRRVLEAYLAHWAADSAANPISVVDGRRMIDPEGMHLWCWDARPYPVFPSRGDVWADVEAWTRGHWLSGRVGVADVATVIADLCARAGLEAQTLKATGLIAGLVVEGASAPRSVLEQLMQLFGLCARVRDGVLHFEPVSGEALPLLPAREVAGSRVVAQRLAADEVPSSLRLRSIDPALSYRVGQVTAHAPRPGAGGVAGLDVPFVLTRDQAQAFAHHALARLMARQTGAELGFAPGDLALEPGDLVALSEGMPGAGAYRVQKVREGKVRALTLAPHVPWLGPVETGASASSAAQAVSTPAFCVLDPPCLSEGAEDTRPLVAVATSEWRGDLPLYVGSDAETATLRAVAGTPAAFGALEWALWPGPVGRWDRAAYVRVRLPRAGLSSVTERALLDGANAFAVQAADGVWEVFQAREAVLVAPDTYDLRTLLRAPVGRWPGSEPIPAGAALVLLDERLVRLDIKAHEANAAVTVYAAASGRLPSHPATASRSFVWQQRALTPPAPAHLRVKGTGTGDTRISWVRCARYGGDDWGAEPPQEAEGERYTVEILRAGAVVRSVATTEPLYVYSEGLRTADLAGGAALTVRVRQLGQGGRLGWARESAL
jgi:hypothetical protein